jgi:hypothetical protein
METGWKNAAHPMDRTANWCIGGCWFSLAVHFSLQHVGKLSVFGLGFIQNVMALHKM